MQCTPKKWDRLYGLTTALLISVLTQIGTAKETPNNVSVGGGLAVEA